MCNVDINCRVSGLIFLQCTRVPDIHLGGILLVDSNWEILGHPNESHNIQNYVKYDLLGIVAGDV